MIDARFFEKILTEAGETIVPRKNLDFRLFDRPIKPSEAPPELSTALDTVNDSIVSECIEQINETMPGSTKIELNNRKLIIKRFHNLFNIAFRIKNSWLTSTKLIDHPKIELVYLCNEPSYDSLLWKTVSQFFWKLGDYFDTIVLESKAGILCKQDIYFLNQLPFDKMTQHVKDICAKFSADCEVVLDYYRPEPPVLQTPLMFFKNLIIQMPDHQNRPVYIINQDVLDNKGFLYEEEIGSDLFNQELIKAHNINHLKKVFYKIDSTLHIDLGIIIRELDPDWLIPFQQKDELTYDPVRGFNDYRLEKHLEIDDDALRHLALKQARLYLELAGDNHFQQIKLHHHNFNISDVLSRELYRLFKTAFNC